MHLFDHGSLGIKKKYSNTSRTKLKTHIPKETTRTACQKQWIIETYQYGCIINSLFLSKIQGKNRKDSRNSWGSSNIGIRELKALTLAPPKTNIIPIGHLVLVNTNSSCTSIRAGINLRNPAYCNTSIRSWVFRKCTNLLQHPLGRAYSLAHKIVIRPLLTPSWARQALLFCPPSLHPEGLSSYYSRYGCP